ncbi:hydrogenase maturation protease [Thermodesulfitimonas autotrophica]|uniref:Hydrogenase maturation protease n=1 Tax=Thermodesulfitimonas autotrophica TaxID=1894989 RepID=A0A3N5BTW9_9THEO|nr:HyaD/HybD family hydrogenase maturation endopeptidase [Thermodesulfitimonas autotrophica]RPF49315.1 hydrogenase maturation protease [Thermodesulfitimonas autotrophica]
MQGDLRRLLVLGVGNVLLRDEGIGVHAVRELRQRGYPPEVEIVDGGTAGLDLLHFIEDASHLIVIDAVNGGAAPGTLFRFTPEELDGCVPVSGYSLHGVGLLEVLHLARAMGVLPPTVIFGIQPADLSWGTELSAPVAARLPRLLELIHEEIESWLTTAKLRLEAMEG